MRFFRLLKISSVVIHHGLDEFLPLGLARSAVRIIFFWRRLPDARAVRLRLALESLGPIFIKFGQILSTRPDLVPQDIAAELARLQDRVPPFGEADVTARLSEAFDGKDNRPSQTWRNIFSAFDMTPIASASIAQVHFATIAEDNPTGKHGGREVAVKILRPNIHELIKSDIGLLYVVADLVVALFADGARLRPKEVVAEFDKSLNDELDLVREASNASTLRRNFADGTLLYVPEVFFDFTSKSLMVMERIDAIQVNDVAQLLAYNIDLERLATDGVKIFFTQVFRDGFFHADMHPGNIFVGRDGIYSGVDFGIMGSLSDADKSYLARNFAAFFERDYKAVAIAHIEAGWVPKNTRVDEFEAAIRSVCEPIFDKPLNEIYFGNVLLRLFDVSRRFRMEIQPQLVLLQKTLLQVEGLGRQLYPQLDLRPVAQPILKQWMNEQIGFSGLMKQIRKEGVLWTATIPALPRLVHRALENNPSDRLAAIELAIIEVNRTQRLQTLFIGTLVAMASIIAMLYLYLLLFWA